MNLGGPEVAFIYVVLGFAFAALTTMVASSKGYRYPALWFLVGLLTGCFGLIMVLVIPSHNGPVTAGTVARFARSFPLDGGAVCTRGSAVKVHDVDVKQGTPAALVDGPDGQRYWVPTSVLRSA